MHVSPVVFCERTGGWAAAWRRVETRLAARENRRPLSPRLIETRSPTECREVVASRRASFVVAELAAPFAEQTFDLLFDLATDAPEASAAVVAEREMLPYEELARELGAQAFVVSPFGLEALRRLALRHLGRPAPESVDVRQRIWEALPWS
ncbi:MAG TPA: hypothetical protein VHC22_15925 [Pirellulales bacterium]|nr:hypothetical protein [Pirellulales bacterium]